MDFMESQELDMTEQLSLFTHLAYLLLCSIFYHSVKHHLIFLHPFLTSFPLTFSEELYFLEKK